MLPLLIAGVAIFGYFLTQTSTFKGPAPAPAPLPGTPAGGLQGLPAPYQPQQTPVVVPDVPSQTIVPPPAAPPPDPNVIYNGSTGYSYNTVTGIMTGPDGSTQYYPPGQGTQP